ncbi:MAG TPA: 3-oxoacyl-ACP reductase family protein [Acetobacteraceae bacterium]|nr:3-oxoacyl-ACP reductase family protein [Acetobacteraceae bacterium]
MLTTENFRLDGRVALITGSGRNIGRAIAEAFAASGAKVVVNGHRDQAALDDVVAGIRARGGEASSVLADVADDAAVGRMVQHTVDTFGGIDIVVSNVGIRKMRPFLEITPDEWDDVLRSNLSAGFYLARHAIPHMRAKQWGRIIVISGADGFWGHVTLRAANITAKQGMHGLAKAIAREFGADGITANTVSPGPIDTVRDWSQYVHQPRERITAEVPLGRYGHVDEIAGACLFLASAAGGYVSGQVIHVNGGHNMY